MARVRRRARFALPDRRRSARRRRVRARGGRGWGRPPCGRGRGARQSEARGDRRRGHRRTGCNRRRIGRPHGMNLSGRLGALAERNYRLFFSSTTISALGDGVAQIALVFAILDISDSPASIGIVLACRQVAAARVTLAAGVWADRPPRHLVLVAASVVQGAVQAIVGTLLLTGHATVLSLAVLAVVYGVADGFVLPASQGLIPAVVS